MTIIRRSIVDVSDLMTSASLAAVDQSKLFDQYLTGLNSVLEITRGVPQASYPFAQFDWGGKNPQPDVVPFERLQALNVVPNYSIGDESQYGTNPGFGAQYKAFLGKIAVDAGAEAQKYQDAINSASAQLSKDSNSATAAWKNYQSSNKVQLSYSDYLAGPGKNWGSVLAGDQVSLDSANAAYTNYLNSIKGPIADALDQYQSNLVTATTSGGSNIANQPDWITSETAYGYVQQITNNNFGGDATHGNSMRFTVNQSTSQFHSEAYSGSGSVSYGGFFGFSANGSYSSYNESLFGSTYSLDFGFQDLSLINVTPGPWYDSSIPTNYKNGPFYPGYSGFKSGSNVYYFGTGGNLARQITGLIVGYRPSIAITASQNYATKAQQVWQAGGGISIGPFSFGASASGSQQSASASFSSTSVNITGKGDWGVIVGYVTNWVVIP